MEFAKILSNAPYTDEDKTDKLRDGSIEEWNDDFSDHCFHTVSHFHSFTFVKNAKNRQNSSDCVSYGVCGGGSDSSS